MRLLKVVVNYGVATEIVDIIVQTPKPIEIKDLEKIWEIVETLITNFKRRAGWDSLNFNPDKARCNSVFFNN